MLIKELELLGFKSFATKTKIEFSQKTTAIVGPNGSGKSNILDALKWVLGERSIRSMRGEKMEDIIFSGTETQKASNYAQVNLMIDNQKRELNINIDTVTIGRRFYRDGESQYLINEKQVSIKDIHELLMDTGLGKSCYSFMEQGRMDSILSSKPDERRTIFEEAAGISKFRAQQEEAEKSLFNTNNNISRIKDVLSELERELKLKSEQSNQTKLFNELNTKYKEIDLRLMYASIIDYEAKIIDLESKIVSKHHHREKIKQRLLRLEELLHSSNTEKEEQIKHLYERKNKIQERVIKITQNKEIVEQSDKRKNTLLQEAKQFTDKMKSVINRIQNFTKEIQEYSHQELQLTEQIKDNENTKKQLELELQTLHHTITDSTKKVEMSIKEQNKNKEQLKKLREQQQTAIQNLLIQLKLEKKNYVEQTATNKVSNKNEVIIGIKSIYNELKKITNYPSPEKITNILNKIDLEKWEEVIEELLSIEKIFKKILVEKEGVYAQKEVIDQKIEGVRTTYRRVTNDSNRKSRNY